MANTLKFNSNTYFCAAVTVFVEIFRWFFDLSFIYFLLVKCCYSFWSMVFLYLIVDGVMSAISTVLLSKTYKLNNVKKEDILQIMYEYQLRRLTKK